MMRRMMSMERMIAKDEEFKRKDALVEEDFENRLVRFVENDARVVESEGGGFVRRTGEIKRGSRIARGS